MVDRHAEGARGFTSRGRGVRGAVGAISGVGGLTAGLLVLLSSSCQVPLRTNDWSTYEGPGAEYFQREEIEFPHVDDPIEPLNRRVFVLNNWLMLGVVRPLGWAYDKVVPAPVTTGISNAFGNLLYPGRLLGNLLQGNGGGAWDETKRFAVNSTVGVLGFWDRASEMGIEPSREDLGQAFGVWGWRDSTYLMIPFLGPSTVRDGIGSLGDAAVDPAIYYPPTSVVRSVHSATRVVETYREFVTSNFDPYELGRLLYVYYRELQLDDFEYGLESDDSGAVETLGSISLRHGDPEFPDRGVTHRVASPASGRDVTYTVWLQEGLADPVYYLPGTGSHRLSGASLAVAENIHRGGSLPITISSTLNHEFIREGLSQPLPGYLPSDTRDVHGVLDAIDRDLRRRYPGRIGERRGLVGLSLGGMQTLMIAARESESEDPWIQFETYVALGAPVDLGHSLRQLDRYYNTALQFPRERRRGWVLGVLRKTLDLAEGTLVPTGSGLPFTRTEAEFLIGLSFRNTIRDVIYLTQDREDMGVLKTHRSHWNRASAHREILQFSFMEYLFAFLLPHYAGRIEGVEFTEEGAARLLRDCNLRSVEAGLLDNPKVRYVGNTNDFLMTPEDFEWVRRTLGDDRVLFFERGGHTGNLHVEDIQDAIREFVVPGSSGDQEPAP